MEIPHSLRRGRPDGRDLCRADLSRVIIEFEKNLEKNVHTVRAGENNPVIGMRILHQFGELAKIAGWFDPDSW